MKQLIFVTSNKGKFKQVRAVLKDYGVRLQQKELDLLEPDVDELEKIALAKARQAFKELKQPLIVEDTGVYFLAYKNFPGPMAKRVFMSLGFKGITRLLKGVTRKGSMKSVFCLALSPRKFKLFSAEAKGTFIGKPREKTIVPLPYDNIFIHQGESRTNSQLSLKEKNLLNHRGKAARQLGEFLKKKA